MKDKVASLWLKESPKYGGELQVSIMVVRHNK
jgi:hypothetical protein